MRTLVASLLLSGASAATPTFFCDDVGATNYDSGTPRAQRRAARTPGAHAGSAARATNRRRGEQRSMRLPSGRWRGAWRAHSRSLAAGGHRRRGQTPGGAARAAPRVAQPSLLGSSQKSSWECCRSREPLLPCLATYAHAWPAAHLRFLPVAHSHPFLTASLPLPRALSPRRVFIRLLSLDSLQL